MHIASMFTPVRAHLPRKAPVIHCRWGERTKRPIITANLPRIAGLAGVEAVATERLG